MKGSEFLAANKGKSLGQWEALALSLAQQDSLVPWSMLPISVTSKDGKHNGVFFTASDYLAIGTFDDYVRLPLTPGTAQKIANLNGMLLPTSQMVESIWRASQKLVPIPMVPNRGANLQQYADHSRLIDEQLSSAQSSHLPVSGHKKDVIISNIWKPGKVVIFGWYRPDGTRIQPKSNIHGDFYVDYSHGIRLISPNMQVNGQSMSVEEVLRSPVYSSLLSSEGVVTKPRYPTGTTDAVATVTAVRTPSKRVSYYQLGFSVLLALENQRRKIAV